MTFYLKRMEGNCKSSTQTIADIFNSSGKVNFLFGMKRFVMHSISNIPISLPESDQRQLAIVYKGHDTQFLWILGISIHVLSYRDNLNCYYFKEIFWTQKESNLALLLIECRTIIIAT